MSSDKPIESAACRTTHWACDCVLKQLSEAKAEAEKFAGWARDFQKDRDNWLDAWQRASKAEGEARTEIAGLRAERDKARLEAEHLDTENADLRADVARLRAVVLKLNERKP